MAYKTLSKMVDERLKIPHDKCKECPHEEECYLGGRGVYYCTRWEDDWNSEKPTNVTVETNSSSQEAKSLPPAKKKSNAVKDDPEEDQGSLF